MEVGKDVRYNLNGKSSREIARDRLKDKKPKKHLPGFGYHKDKVKDLQKSAHCEKHGDFDFLFTEFTKDRVGVRSMCNECIQEFDALLDIEEEKIEKERAFLIKEKSDEKERNYLLSNGFSKRYLDKSFDNYIADTQGKKNALSKCKELCDSLIAKEQGNNIIMVGGVGTGKTHLANAMVKKLYRNGIYATRMNLIDIVRDLKSTWSKDSDISESELLSLYHERGLLIIDEVGIQFGSDTEKMFLFNIINGRYEECMPTVIISNLDVNGVKNVIGERCVDRLREDGGKVIAFDWGSNR